MPDTLNREKIAAIRKRDRAFSEGDVIGPNYYGGAQAKWDRRSLLAHIDALTAAVRPVIRAYLANDEKGLQGALADLSAEPILRGEQ